MNIEIISAAFLCILWVYSYGRNLLHTLRNRLFQMVFFSILLSSLVNIILIFASAHAGTAGQAVLLCLQTLHYIVSPLVSLNCALYTLAYIAEETGKKPLRGICILTLLYAAYVALVFVNFFSGVFFRVDSGGILVRQPLFRTLSLVYLVYSVAMYLLIFRNRNRIQPDLRRIFLLFPTVILAFAVFQQIFPGVIFGDIVSVGSLLTACLYLQNKRVSEDQLTGIPNRSAFLRMLQFFIRKKSAFITMEISLNDFKFINDKYGQVNGDLFLKEIAGFLRQVVPVNGAFRVGGDTFAVLFEGKRLETAGADICQIADRFGTMWEVPGCSCHISASIGVAHYPASADNCGDLVSMLESAIDRAQKTGNSQPIFCDRRMIERLRRRHALYETMRSALRAGTLEVYYQPLYSVEKDRFTEAEALVRLRGDDGLFVSPEEFIPIAEETGLIEEIGYFVLGKVCKSICSLLQQGLEIESVSVNISVVQLMKSDFVPRVLQIIRGSGITPHRIIFEITESILIRNFAVVAEKIMTLSEAGIRFALDDFGTGYSNLAQVIDLPFHVVKIDKSLIWDSMNNQRCYTMVKSLTDTFKSIHLMVTAEGVETLEHDHFVRICGCDRIQGFRYARPMPWEQALEYLGKSPNL